MKPLKLIMSGWGCFSDKVEIDFTKFRQEGLFLVTGPTGAGKTTLFDGISYGLFGNVSGKYREKDMVRSDFCSADTETYVELYFLHKGKRYTIKRSPRYERPKKRGKGMTLSLETAVFCLEGEPPETSVNEVNRQIEELMGLNYMQFKQIAMIAQGEFLELLFSNSGDRTAILRNLFQTAQYDRLQKYLTDRAKKIFRNREEIRNRMEEATAMIDSGEEEELSLLLNQEMYSYDIICDKTDNLIEADRKMASEFESDKMVLEHKIKELLLAIEDGKKRNEKIAELQEAERQYSILEERIPEIKVKERKLSMAEAAERVFQEERMHLGSRARKDAVHDRLIETAQKKKRLEEEDAFYEEETEAVMVLEEQAVVFEKQYQELKGYLPVILDLKQVKVKLSEEENKQIQYKKEIFCLKETRDTILKDQNQDVVFLEQLGEVEEELGRVQIALAEEKHLLKEAEFAIICWNERIRLQNELDEYQTKYQTAEDRLTKERRSYEEKESIYRQAAIGLAAKYLKENMPCPVCGSLEHPNKAEISSDVPDREQMEKEKKRLDLLEQEYNNVYRQAATKNGMLQTKTQEWNAIESRLFPNKKIAGTEVQSKKMFEKEMEQNLQRINQIRNDRIFELDLQAKNCYAKKEKKEILKLRIENRKEEWSAADDKISIAEIARKESVSRQNVLSENEAVFLSRLPEEYRSEQKVRGKMEYLEDRVRKNRSKAEEQRKKKEEVKRLLAAMTDLEQNQKKEWELAAAEESKEKEKYLSILKEQGFLNEESYRNAKLPQEEKQNLNETIRSFFDTIQRSQVYLERLHDEITSRERCRIDDLVISLKESEERAEVLQKKKESVLLRLMGNQKAISLVKKRLEEKNKLDAEYGIIRDLDKAARGENREKLVFEQYVLGYYFEDILFAANRRFLLMTGGRYELRKVSKVYDARTKDSLDLEVLDFYTGKCRSVKSLSGGEAFKAALSFALGMSDTIQRYAGGIEIDTLFIDEGFGSLDLESLDQALDTIVMQSGKGRLIGIISHVAELKERLDQQIVVEKTAFGSKLCLLS